MAKDNPQKSNPKPARQKKIGAIRQFLRTHPKAPDQRVIRALAKDGIQVGPGLVKKTRADLPTFVASKPKPGPAAKAGAQQTPNPAVKPAADQARAARIAARLLKVTGDFPSARRALRQANREHTGGRG
jgi:hypothetical protein